MDSTRALADRVVSHACDYLATWSTTDDDIERSAAAILSAVDRALAAGVAGGA